MRFVILTSLVLLVSLTIQAAVPRQISVDAAFDINDLSTLNQLVQGRTTIDPRAIEQMILAKKILRVLEEEASDTESPAYQDKINKEMLAHLLRDEKIYKVVQALIGNKSMHESMQGILLVPYMARSSIGEISAENVDGWLSQVRGASVPPLSPEEQAIIEQAFARAVPETNLRKREESEERERWREEAEDRRGRKACQACREWRVRQERERREGRREREGRRGREESEEREGRREREESEEREGRREREESEEREGRRERESWREEAEDRRGRKACQACREWRVRQERERREGRREREGRRGREKREWGLWSDEGDVPMSELDELEAKLQKGESVQGSSQLAIILDEMKQEKEASEKDPDVQLSQAAIETPFFCEADSIRQYSKVCSTYFGISASA